MDKANNTSSTVFCHLCLFRKTGIVEMIFLDFWKEKSVDILSLLSWTEGILLF